MLIELVQGGELWDLFYDRAKVDATPSLRQPAGVHRSIAAFLPKVAMFYIGCISSALARIHDKGVLFRDLKPENIMIDDAGYCKVSQRDCICCYTWLTCLR